MVKVVYSCNVATDVCVQTCGWLLRGDTSVSDEAASDAQTAGILLILLSSLYF